MRQGVLFAVVASALSAAAIAAAFGSSVPTAAAATCPPPPVAVYPFTPWGDGHEYVLTTGASFEDGLSGWTLQGGAAITSGNAPNALDSASASHSLYLPAGSSATSPCTTAPHIVGVVRFFAKNVGVSGGELKVEVLVKGGVYLAGTITGNGQWSASPMLPSNAPNYSGAVAYQVRLTPVGAGSAFDVDDVYFDPYASK